MNFEELGNLFVLYGLNVVYALGLLLIGWWIASVLERMVLRALAATHRVDPTVAGFLANLCRYGVLVFVGVAVLQRFGIQTTSIIAVLGATSLAIGLALQGTLANLAAGVMLLLFRPFRVGDAVEVGGQAGTVKGLTLFTTEIASGDNVQVLMPNGRVWGAPIINKSAYDLRRFDLVVEVKPDVDVEGLLAQARSFLENDPRVKTQPGPSAAITRMAFDRVEVSLSGWASASDAGAIKTALTTHVRSLLRAAPPAENGEAAFPAQLRRKAARAQPKAP
ncbi:mechanosensitive ion channel [Ancylobacter sp. A5.8]|uniref:mechanosensitive ion channel family protein n=1 Tax=Ancylobacter gelatini TaxID=2919920 RepID=UPI001F4EE184|nr:mechanosensitive ion channel domain-containing protein [Ancylobacter gelatini]MCJ8143248.1 mechanosensitive ion channel [Ancylobacter gelatini]